MIWLAFALFFQDDVPRVLDDRLQLQLVATEPDIVTPTGLAIDKRGRVFVIESHTHFPPKDYAGPRVDRIHLLDDFQSDGRAGRNVIFHEGGNATMNLVFSPTGDLVVATRMEVYAIPRAGEIDHAGDIKRLVHLETAGDYPHNGLSGLAFSKDRMWIGLGENLGAEYRVVGSDGSFCAGGGEGGSVYSCTLDGKDLQRVATGFWNPFAMFRFPEGGPTFVVDNDPDARPPCRLLHLVQGGDYGFKFRYGRNGLHPFHAWNGELPGTLPMVTGTGEAPSGIVGYLATMLPDEFFGSLLVTSWGDHRIERYRLQPHGNSYRSTLEPIVEGGENFRPVGIDVAPDGSVYFSDWVDKSYELHGKGRVWRLSVKPGTPKPNAERALPVHLRQDQLKSPLVNNDPDPFYRTSQRNDELKQPVADLLARFRASKRTAHVDAALVLRDLGAENAQAWIKNALADDDPDVRLVAIQFIGEKKLEQYQSDVESMLTREGKWTRALFESTLATLELLERGWPAADAGAAFAVKFLEQGRVDSPVARYALRSIPADHPWLTRERFAKLLEQGDARWKIDVVRTLRESPLPERSSMLESIRDDRALPDDVRDEANLGIAARPANPTNPKSVTDADIARLAQMLSAHPADSGTLEKGERLFFSPVGPGCYRCHQVEGRGGVAGPDLTTIARTGTERKLVESVLRPSQEIAPLFVPWLISTVDGRVQSGVLVREGLKGEQFYVGPDGKEFMITPTEIDERKASTESIMPAGLLDDMSDESKLALLAFLKSLK